MNMSLSSVNAVNAYGSMDALSVNESEPSMLSQTAQEFAKVFETADASVEGFATGQVDTQTVVEALTEAEMALQTAVTVRDRLIGAYQELLRMPL